MTRGRPKVPDPRERISIRVSEEELSRIDSLARAAGLDRSSWIRARSLSCADEDLARAVRQVRAHLAELEQTLATADEALDELADKAGVTLEQEGIRTR